MINATSTTKIGTLSAMKFIARCLERGWSISLPLGNYGKYDCVLDRGNGLERVQIKTGRMKNGVVEFFAFSVRRHSEDATSPAKYIVEGYRGDVEAFGVFCLALNKSYLVPIKDVPKAQCSLRTEETKNKQKKNIRWAKDYEI